MYTSTTLTAVISLLVIAIITSTECKPAKDNLHMYNIQACGKELADLLATTCHLGYNTITKTFTPAPEADRISKESKEDTDDKEKDLEMMETSMNREKRDSRHKRAIGIIQECCVQPCRWNDLLAYCFNGSAMKEGEQLLTEQE